MTYQYKKNGSQTDLVAWGGQLTNSQGSNVACPVVYKLYAKDCAAAAPTGFSIASTKDQVVIADIGTTNGYTQELCIEASNGYQTLKF